MIVPKKIKIGGREIEIKYKNKVIADDGDECVGYAEAEKGIITLIPKGHNGLCEDEFNINFLHEAIHIIETVYSIELSEQEVNALSEGFYQIQKQIEANKN